MSYKLYIFFQFGGITETWFEVFEPILNRMYYSADNNAYIYSQFANKGSSFMCNWTAIPKENTTDFQCNKISFKISALFRPISAIIGKRVIVFNSLSPRIGIDDERNHSAIFRNRNRRNKRVSIYHQRNS